MQTFYQLKALPKVGDLIMKEIPDEWGNPIVTMVTKIVGTTYHTSHHIEQSMHYNYLSSWYCPLSQEIK